MDIDDLSSLGSFYTFLYLREYHFLLNYRWYLV